MHINQNKIILIEKAEKASFNNLPWGAGVSWTILFAGSVSFKKATICSTSSATSSSAVFSFLSKEWVKKSIEKFFLALKLSYLHREGFC